MQTDTIALIKNYYDYFNQQDLTSFFALLDDNVIHDINQGVTEEGKTAFADFMQRMNQSYQEKVQDLVVMASENGARAAAEFFIAGVYKATDKGLPVADNQTYRLRCGAFFEIKNGKITRVTNYYNMQDWLRQVKE